MLYPRRSSIPVGGWVDGWMALLLYYPFMSVVEPLFFSWSLGWTFRVNRVRFPVGLVGVGVGVVDVLHGRELSIALIVCIYIDIYIVTCV